ncbi:uncharacterized protein UDID_08832 [Ustilago sp. UG-2017a]|nr:uncharacterized protein UDID_08832 [Ustilago sp. UG-2017a]
MVKHDSTKDESDTFDEISEQQIKSPKKRKMGAKKEESSSPDGKGKAAATRMHTHSKSWTKEEEEDLMDCLQIIIMANMAQIIKGFPRLAARKSRGCIKHWYTIRRKHEAAILGAATINYNGKKIDIADRIKVDPAKSK